MSVKRILESLKNQKVKRLTEDADNKKLYGATMDEWSEAGAYDSGGIGFLDGDYEFTPDGLGQMAADMFQDGYAGFEKPSAVEKWEKAHKMSRLAAKRAKELEAEDYTYYGGVLVYDPDGESDIEYEVLINDLSESSEIRFRSKRIEESRRTKKSKSLNEALRRIYGPKEIVNFIIDNEELDASASLEDIKNYMEDYDWGLDYDDLSPENIIDIIMYVVDKSPEEAVELFNSISPYKVKDASEVEDIYLGKIEYEDYDVMWNLKDEFVKKLGELMTPEIIKLLDKKLHSRKRIMTPEALAKLASSSDVDKRRKAAMDPNTPAEALAKLASDSLITVVWDVAENPSTPAEVLAKLASGESANIRRSVAKNPSTPSDVLAKLAADPVDFVRDDALRNPNYGGK